MKHFIMYLFVIFTLSSCKFLEELITIYGLWMRNDSDELIAIWSTYDQSTNTLLPQNKPDFDYIARSVDLESENEYPLEEHIMISHRNWLEQLSNKDTVRIFIFNHEIIENTDWSVVRDQYLVEQRYDLTKEQLIGLNYRIAYPPTPEMKDVKMWPPYEEAIKQDEKQAE